MGPSRSSGTRISWKNSSTSGIVGTNHEDIGPKSERNCTPQRQTTSHPLVQDMFMQVTRHLTYRWLDSSSKQIENMEASEAA
jgi:hypothetical protein